MDQCSKSETVGYVKKYYPDAAPRAELIAEFSGGILGSAKAMAEGGEYFELRRAFYETLSKTAAANPAGLFEICDFVHKNKEKLNLILNFLLSWLRDAVCVKLTGEEKIIIAGLSPVKWAGTCGISQVSACLFGGSYDLYC